MVPGIALSMLRHNTCPGTGILAACGRGGKLGDERDGSREFRSGEGHGALSGDSATGCLFLSGERAYPGRKMPRWISHEMHIVPAEELYPSPAPLSDLGGSEKEICSESELSAREPRKEIKFIEARKANQAVAATGEPPHPRERKESWGGGGGGGGGGGVHTNRSSRLVIPKT